MNLSSPPGTHRPTWVEPRWRRSKPTLDVDCVKTIVLEERDSPRTLRDAYGGRGGVPGVRFASPGLFSFLPSGKIAVDCTFRAADGTLPRTRTIHRIALPKLLLSIPPAGFRPPASFRVEAGGDSICTAVTFRAMLPKAGHDASPAVPATSGPGASVSPGSSGWPSPLLRQFSFF